MSLAYTQNLASDKTITKLEPTTDLDNIKIQFLTARSLSITGASSIPADIAIVVHESVSEPMNILYSVPILLYNAPPLVPLIMSLEDDGSEVVSKKSEDTNRYSVANIGTYCHVDALLDRQTTSRKKAC